MIATSPYRFALQTLTVCLVASACAGTGAEASSLEDSELRESKLEVAHRASLPVDEVSGLGRRIVDGKAQYLAVADAMTTLLTFDADASGKTSKVTKHDLSALFGRQPSQWEAVAGDSAGNVFILAEGTDEIRILSPDLKRLAHTIELTLPRGHALEDAWRDDLNSHGEGMVLLANGHIVVVKEKNPVSLIEFAPAGEVARGYSAELSLGMKAFPVPRGATSTMTAVHHWLLKDSDNERVPDVSELAVDVDGRLLLLSDQGRVIVRVERGLRADEDKIDLKELFKLPAAIDKPEGLVLASGIPLVAVDEKKSSDTLFTLKRMP